MTTNRGRCSPGGGAPQYQVCAAPRGQPRSQGLFPGLGCQGVWFLSRFGLKTGIDFEHFGLKLGMVIGGTFAKAYKLIFLPSIRGKKLVREKEK